MFPDLKCHVARLGTIIRNNKAISYLFHLWIETFEKNKLHCTEEQPCARCHFACMVLSHSYTSLYDSYGQYFHLCFAEEMEAHTKAAQQINDRVRIQTQGT